MPFNTLLLSCLMPKISYSEQGCSVSIKPQSDENILFFSIDNESNKNCTMTQDLEITGAKCDLLIYYSTSHKKTICFVELKGKDIGHAIVQLINTKTNFNCSLKHSLNGKACYKYYKNIEWKACIITHGSSPKDIKKYKNKLENNFKNGNYRITRDKDIGEFIRK